MNPKKILLAIDHNESSLRAVKYLGHICGSSPGFIVTILHIIEMPEEDFFRTQAERDEFLEHERERSWVLLKQARDELAGQGLNPEHLHLEMEVRGCDSMASCILEKVRLGSGTLVVGRRGVSKSEEFLFGSVSKKAIDLARECTVWVVH